MRKVRDEQHRGDPLQPGKALILDIETLNPTDEEMEVELELLKPAANIKDDVKRKANLRSQQERARRKSGLLDSSRIGCVGMMSDEWSACFTSYAVGTDCFDIMKNMGVMLFSFPDEKLMLKGLSDFLGNVGSEKKLVTFNGKSFDLPKIRFRYARMNLQVPSQFGRYIEHDDLMLIYSNFYSQSNIKYISMDDVIRRLGILPNGKPFGGEMFQQLIDEGKTTLATLYNVFDLHLTNSIRLRLSA